MEREPLRKRAYAPIPDANGSINGDDGESLVRNRVWLTEVIELLEMEKD